MLGISISAVVPIGYTLVWNDEFDGTRLDTSKWTAENIGSPRNNELQYYTPEDVLLQNGTLVLRSQKRSYDEYQFTSGAVQTKGKFTQAYGRFEFRARLPTGGKGIWPALWLYPGSTWPPEIDVLETVNDMSTIWMTYHWGTSSNHLKDSSYYHNDALATDYHNYAVEWEPGTIRWYIDGVQRKEYTGSNVTNIPMLIYMNIAIGGTWPGNPDGSTVFPQYFYIDYVRVYKKEPLLQHLFHQLFSL